MTRLELLGAYRSNRPALKALVEDEAKKIETDLETAGLNVAFVQGRAKGVGSYAAKLLGPEPKSDPLRDFMALRVITYFQQDKEAVIQRLKAIYGERNVSEQPERVEALEAWEFAYRTRHLHCQMTTDRMPEGCDLDAFWFEIQVRTLCEHTWAAVDHQLRYKAVSPLQRQELRVLFRSAAVLENVDGDFEKLHDVVTSDMTPDGLDVQRGQLNVRLTPEVVDTLVKSDDELLEACLQAADAGWTFLDEEPVPATGTTTGEGTGGPRTPRPEIADLVALAKSLGVATAADLKQQILSAFALPGIHDEVRSKFDAANYLRTSTMTDYFALMITISHDQLPMKCYERWDTVLLELQSSMSPSNRAPRTPETETDPVDPSAATS